MCRHDDADAGPARVLEHGPQRAADWRRSKSTSGSPKPECTCSGRPVSRQTSSATLEQRVEQRLLGEPRRAAGLDARDDLAVGVRHLRPLPRADRETRAVGDDALERDRLARRHGQGRPEGREELVVRQGLSQKPLGARLDPEHLVDRARERAPHLRERHRHRRVARVDEQRRDTAVGEEPAPALRADGACAAPAPPPPSPRSRVDRRNPGARAADTLCARRAQPSCPRAPR